MDWKQENNTLVAETDFGRYTIFVKHGIPKTFGVKLNSGDTTHTMEGEYGSIARATEAAETDLRHRENMWEVM